MAAERGIRFPPELRESLESLPSVLEGVAEGPSWSVTFGLGHDDPLTELIVEARAHATELDSGMLAIENAIGTAFRALGEPAAD